jgi:hypothetical protein
MLVTYSCALKETTNFTVHKYTIETSKYMMPIAAMDSTFFDAYNKCDMDKQAEIYADTNFITTRWFNDIKQRY